MVNPINSLGERAEIKLIRASLQESKHVSDFGVRMVLGAQQRTLSFIRGEKAKARSSVHA